MDSNTLTFLINEIYSSIYSTYELSYYLHSTTERLIFVGENKDKFLYIMEDDTMDGHPK